MLALAAAQVPLMGVAGNHEIEEDARRHRFQAFETRYRYPYAESGSDSPQYYSFNAAGTCSPARLAKTFVLTCSAGFNFSASWMCRLGSPQYRSFTAAGACSPAHPDIWLT